MTGFFRMCGPYGAVLALLALVLVTIALRLGFLLAIGSPSSRAAARRELNALPFWGAIALVVGILGQATAAYKSLSAIVSAPMVNPQRVAEGFYETFLTSMLGLAVFGGALLLWLALQLWQARKEAASRTTKAPVRR